MDRVVIHRALDQLLDALEQRSVAAAPSPVDDLVLLTVEALEARGLEHRPIVRLAESGALKTVRIGRRRYTKASWLAELAETLPAIRPAEDEDELTAAARRRARRVA